MVVSGNGGAAGGIVDRGFRACRAGGRAPLAGQLDFAVTIFDDRPELANREFFPAAVKLRVGAWHELLKLRPPAGAFGLIVTRGHQHDALTLSEWIRLPFAFLGLIGSRRKARIIREQFLRQQARHGGGVRPRRLSRWGWTSARSGPQEIAVSILGAAHPATRGPGLAVQKAMNTATPIGRSGVIILGAGASARMGTAQAAAAVARVNGHRPFAGAMAGAGRGANRDCAARRGHWRWRRSWTGLHFAGTWSHR